MDLIGVALALLLVLRDRVRRPALARVFRRLVSAPAKPPPPPTAGAGAVSSTATDAHSRLVDPGTSLDALPENNSSSNNVSTYEPEGNNSNSPSFGAEEYSVWVSDPPPDATDPDAWHKYFQRYGEVLAMNFIYVSPLSAHSPTCLSLAEAFELELCMIISFSSYKSMCMLH